MSFKDNSNKINLLINPFGDRNEQIKAELAKGLTVNVVSLNLTALVDLCYLASIEAHPGEPIDDNSYHYTIKVD